MSTQSMFLNHLSEKSIGYLKSVIQKNGRLKGRFITNQNLSNLKRTVVHTNPHMDEYMAELIFRCGLPKKMSDIDIEELSVHAQENDSNCLAIWPNSAIFGIGANFNSISKPLIIFDEHLDRGNRLDVSCSQLVANKLFIKTPYSIKVILNEVNDIDSRGGAHPQHISNLFKTINSTRYIFSKKSDFLSFQGSLTTRWKRAIFDACIAAMVSHIENEGVISLLERPEDKKASLEKSFELYTKKTSLRNEKGFLDAVQRVKSDYYGQKTVFKRAKLSTEKAQLLVLSRISYVLEKFWGMDTATVIMLHFWESIFQNQIAFSELQNKCIDFLKNEEECMDTQFGMIKKYYIQIEKSSTENLLVLIAYPSPRWSQSNKLLNYVINRYAAGFGISIIRDCFIGTNAIFKGTHVTQDNWEKLGVFLEKEEQECWHFVKNAETGKLASFFLNGTKAHQYIPRSELVNEEIINFIKQAHQK